MSRSKFPTILSIFFLFLIPSSVSLSFNLSTIGPNDVNRNINITFDAYISNQGIQVTPDERNLALGRKAGRATYVEPLHLWDRASGNLTDFSTHFSFVIDSSGSSDYADGLAFFMAPVGSSIQNDSYGGGLGLGPDPGPDNSSSITPNASYSRPYVAIEFDTFPNHFDPAVPHVGIDINSLRSVNTTRWQNNITLGAENDAWIRYNASSRTLRVDFTGFSSNRTTRGSLVYVVDLREYLPEYVIFGFSAATGDWFEKNNVKSWDFTSSLEFNISSVEPSPSPQVGVGGKGDRKGLWIGLGVGVPILVLGLVFVSCWLWKKRYKEYLEDEALFDPSMDNEFEKGSGPKRFSYSQLARATNDFSEDEKLGEGGFGGVYRGFLKETNANIAVKRVSRGSKQGLKEYASEVKIISQLRHRNLVQLIGWCHERGELLLVYEFMPNGSLDSHLFKDKQALNWEMRYKIAQGLASALLYLHEEWERCVVHRDIKSSNIMLDANFNSKLGDFGLARLVDHEKGSQTTVLAGTMGYMAPECVMTGRASKESDVYSFGVVLLEIASGKRPICYRGQENQVRLVEWVWELYGREKLLDAADPKLNKEFDAREMENLMVVGLWCVHPDYNHRPSIRQVVQVLKFEAQLPSLPSMMPIPTYYTPHNMSMSVLNTGSSYAISSSGGISDSAAYSHYSNSSNLTTSSAGSSPSAALMRN